MHFSLTQFRQISRHRGKKNCLVNLEPGAYGVFLIGSDGAVLLKVHLDPLKMQVCWLVDVLGAGSEQGGDERG